jgi:putative transposase
LPEYRRVLIPGGTFFFTVVTSRRRPILTKPDAREALHYAFKDAQATHPFQIDAICILPDHLHCIWTLPEGDADYSTRWKLVKGYFSRAYLRMGGSGGKITDSRVKKGDLGVWQRRFWEHVIRDSEDYQRHVDYIHYNPVKHRLVRSVSEWQWSSFQRYVRMGYYPPGWGGDESKIKFNGMEFGE